MICPHCDHAIDPAIAAQDPAVRSEVGKLAGSATRTRSGGRNGGRPTIPTQCPRCGAQCESKGSARKHCPRKRA